MKSNLKESKALKIYQNQWFWGRIQNFLWICLPEAKVIEINQTQHEAKAFKKFIKKLQNQSTKMNQNQSNSIKSNAKSNQNQWFLGRMRNFLWICLPESKAIKINQNQHESKAIKKFIKKNQNQSTKMNQNQSHSIKFKAKEFKWIRPNQNLPSSTNINQNQSQ